MPKQLEVELLSTIQSKFGDFRKFKIFTIFEGLKIYRSLDEFWPHNFLLKVLSCPND